MRGVEIIEFAYASALLVLLNIFVIAFAHVRGAANAAVSARCPPVGPPPSFDPRS